MMDEPFAALDFQTRVLMQRFLLEVWLEFKPTIIFVTHHIDEAVLLADRVVGDVSWAGLDYRGGARQPAAPAPGDRSRLQRLPRAFDRNARTRGHASACRRRATGGLPCGVILRRLCSASPICSTSLERTTCATAPPRRRYPGTISPSRDFCRTGMARGRPCCSSTSQTCAPTAHRRRLRSSRSLARRLHLARAPIGPSASWVGSPLVFAS